MHRTSSLPLPRSYTLQAIFYPIAAYTAVFGFNVAFWLLVGQNDAAGLLSTIILIPEMVAVTLAMVCGIMTQERWGTLATAGCTGFFAWLLGLLSLQAPVPHMPIGIPIGITVVGLSGAIAWALRLRA